MQALGDIKERVMQFAGIYPPSDLDGFEEVAQRVQEKYENNDFSEEVHTVTVRGDPYTVELGRADPTWVRELLNRADDPAVGFRIKEDDTEEFAGIYAEDTEMAENILMAGAVAARQDRIL